MGGRGSNNQGTGWNPNQYANPTGGTSNVPNWSTNTGMGGSMPNFSLGGGTGGYFYNQPQSNAPSLGNVFPSINKGVSNVPNMPTVGNVTPNTRLPSVMPQLTSFQVPGFDYSPHMQYMYSPNTPVGTVQQGGQIFNTAEEARKGNAGFYRNPQGTYTATGTTYISKEEAEARAQPMKDWFAKNTIAHFLR